MVLTQYAQIIHSTTDTVYLGCDFCGRICCQRASNSARPADPVPVYTYSIAGYSRGVPNFVIFMVNLEVTKSNFPPTNILSHAHVRRHVHIIIIHIIEIDSVWYYMIGCDCVL